MNGDIHKLLYGFVLRVLLADLGGEITDMEEQCYYLNLRYKHQSIVRHRVWANILAHFEMAKFCSSRVKVGGCSRKGCTSGRSR